MARNIYFDFKDVEEDIKNKAPLKVYKYRTWSNPNHRRLLTHQEAWFAHPFTLNDKNDIRRTIKMNFFNLTVNKIMLKLIPAIKFTHPNSSETEVAEIAKLKCAEIMNDPYLYFSRNVKLLHDNWNIYDKVGVFSVSENGLSLDLWKSEYAANFEGYAIGFDTVELARSIQSLIGKVLYTDEELVIDVSEGFTDATDYKEVFMKYTRWKHEEEFRFLIYKTNGGERIKYFAKKAVSEILIGYKADEKVKTDIIYNVRKIYGDAIPIYLANISEDNVVKHAMLKVL